VLIWTLKAPAGSTKMNDVATTILDGSEGFFKQQYGTIAKLAVVFSIILGALYGVRENPLNLPVQN
jgi:Na+/H+-translocating membrane pyrophosphatase